MVYTLDVKVYIYIYKYTYINRAADQKTDTRMPAFWSLKFVPAKHCKSHCIFTHKTKCN